MPKQIKKGARGPEVERWQTIIAGLGFDPNGIDGNFGNGTLRATREFQRAQGLNPDGIVGRKTWAAGEAASAKPDTLRKGSRGADVQRWQRLLVSKGYDPKGVDGTFGSGTERATKKFQKDNGLNADGLVGPKTWSTAMKSDVVPTPAPPKPKPKPGSGLLNSRIDVSKIPLAPANKAAGKNVGVIKVWNSYGGVLTALSKELEIDPDAAAAVLAIESGGAAMTSSGPVIRFENQWFFNQWGKNHRSKYNSHFAFNSTKRWQGHKWRKSAGGKWQACHKNGQPGEWRVYRFAASLNEDAAIMSMSIGLAQIMGFHYKRMGFSTPRQMLDAYSTGVGAQIVGFFDFVNTSSGNRLLTATRDKDWFTFAKIYNGSGKPHIYSDKMKKAYDQLRATPH